ncbi:MAG: DUF58 domain-containing protein [Pseudomonadota bacterium]|nr:DUF58 domain-containing protein [Pseudomonadota bacterium]
MRILPGKPLLWTLAGIAVAAAAALVAQVPLGAVAWATAIVLLLLAALAGIDAWQSLRQWRASPLRLVRRLPAAMAIGVRSRIPLWLELDSEGSWRGAIHDHTDPALLTDGLPARLHVQDGQRLELEYGATPLRRGDLVFGSAELRLLSRLRLLELCPRVGAREVLRAYPDFAQVSRYAWLAGDRRLQEIGVKTWRRRGAGTSFQQLAEYTPGDPVRDIDWKATLRHDKPIVRQFQDERDQNVWLLIDCGRRMRADDPDGAPGSGHFDQVLNAVMLLSYVALREGDAVGAFTFGMASDAHKWLAPRKGRAQLGTMMGALYDLEPAMTHSDYLRAAQTFLARQPRHSLVIIITNFRDEDCAELADALRLLRQRHLVMVASLRERVISEMMAQPLSTATAADIASAQLHAQARDDAFARLGGRDELLVDAEPRRLGIELVNRYHSAKRSGML